MKNRKNRLSYTDFQKETSKYLKGEDVDPEALPYIEKAREQSEYPNFHGGVARSANILYKKNHDYNEN